MGDCVSDCIYLVDAMSSFGAVPLDFEAGHIDFMVSSANKCMQGVPGFSYAIARRSALEKCKGLRCVCECALVSSVSMPVSFCITHIYSLHI